MLDMTLCKCGHPQSSHAGQGADECQGHFGRKEGSLCHCARFRLSTTQKQPMSARGNCQVCNYRFPLRKDGTVQPHRLWYGAVFNPFCEGSGKPPRLSAAVPESSEQ